MDYLIKSVKDGIKLLRGDERVISKLKLAHKIEDIFFSNLFISYFLMIIVYFVYMLSGEFKLGDKTFYEPILLGLMLLYPFVYNLFIYTIYTIFGFSAELLEKKKSIEPLLVVGFHNSTIYSILLVLIFLITLVNQVIGVILFYLLIGYFFYNLFLLISKIYKLSLNATLIVITVPMFISAFFIFTITLIFPLIGKNLIILLFN